MYFHEGCNGIASFGRSSYGLCVECKTSTKYKCINCKVCVRNRPSCSVAEVDEKTNGRVEYISVWGYNRLMPLDRLEGDHEEEDDEVANILSSKTSPAFAFFVFSFSKFVSIR